MKFTKFSIVLLFLLSFIAFSLTVVLFSVRENEKEKRVKLEQVKLDLEGQISALQADKEKLEIRASELDAKLKEAIQNLDDARSEADQAKQELSQSRKSISDQAAQVDELKKAVRDSEERNRELEDTLNKLEKTLKDMNGAGNTTDMAADGVTGMPSETITVETTDQSKIMELAPAPEPKEAAVAPAFPAEKAAGKASESLQAGRVLLVNQKFNFVIVNMGSKQGLKIGDTFLVTENGEKVVKVQVEKLYDDYSAAKILEVLGNRLQLKEGNLVTRI